MKQKRYFYFLVTFSTVTFLAVKLFQFLKLFLCFSATLMKSVPRGFLESSACLRAPFIPTRCAIGPGSPRGLPLPPAGPNSHPSPGTGSRISSASLTAQARAGAGSLRGHTRSCSAPPAPADRAADR